MIRKLLIIVILLILTLIFLGGCHSDTRKRVPVTFKVDRNSKEYKAILQGVIWEYWKKRELERMENETQNH